MIHAERLRSMCCIQTEKRLLMALRIPIEIVRNRLLVGEREFAVEHVKGRGYFNKCHVIAALYIDICMLMIRDCVHATICRICPRGREGLFVLASTKAELRMRSGGPRRVSRAALKRSVDAITFCN